MIHVYNSFKEFIGQFQLANFWAKKSFFLKYIIFHVNFKVHESSLLILLSFIMLFFHFIGHCTKVAKATYLWSIIPKIFQFLIIIAICTEPGFFSIKDNWFIIYKNSIFKFLEISFISSIHAILNFNELTKRKAESESIHKWELNENSL